MRTHKVLGVAEIAVHKTSRPKEVRHWGAHRQGSPWRTGSGPSGERHCSEQGWADQRPLGEVGRGVGGGLGQTLSKRGLLVDGCVALHGDTTALSAEVVRGDNAHSDNQQGPGRRGPGHCRPGTASGTAHGTCGSMLHGELLPTSDPYQCKPSTQDADPDWAGRRGPHKVAGRTPRWQGDDRVQALHQPSWPFPQVAWDIHDIAISGRAYIFNFNNK